jgi:hypothetical protein
MTTYHVFGDTGGHHKQLKAGLEAIGLDPKTFKLPKDTIVIHCGDLIHKGPLSEAVMMLVDKIMDANPGQWIQLLGNHEFQYLDGAPFFWGAVIPADAQRILASWLEKKRVRVAYAIEGPVEFHDLALSARPFETPNKPVLFTHAGLAKPFWEQHLKSSTNIVEIANAINALPIKKVTAPGSMLYGEPAGGAPWKPVGPVWALSTDEVWGSWKDTPDMPFMQVHGHVTPFNYARQTWWASTSNEYRRNAKINVERCTTVVRVANSIQVAVDPGYSKEATNAVQPALKITTND